MIKISVDKEHAEALRAIELIKHKCTAEFNLVVELLEQNLARLRKQNDTNTGDIREWTQGGCQILKSTVDILKNTRHHLDILRPNQPGQGQGYRDPHRLF